MEELVQRSGVVRRRYKLVPEGIRVTESSWSQGKTVTIPYEIIYGESLENWTASRPALIAAIVMTLLTLMTLVVDAEKFAWLFWLVGAAFAGLYYYASRSEQIGMYDSESRIMFFRDRPSPAALKVFLAEIRARARVRVRERVLPLQRTGDPAIDRNRARALRDREIISDQELEEFERGASGVKPAPLN